MENRNKITVSSLYDTVCEQGFFVLDLKLYLDTHPDDCTALEMYREAVKQYSASYETFEKFAYPLNADDAGECGNWDWLNGSLSV
jgi:hypothetical protein